MFSDGIFCGIERIKIAGLRFRFMKNIQSNQSVKLIRFFQTASIDTDVFYCQNLYRFAPFGAVQDDFVAFACFNQAACQWGNP